MTPLILRLIRRRPGVRGPDRAHARLTARDEDGYALIMLIVLIASGITFIVGFTNWVILHVRAARAAAAREQAMLIAEAGVEYYRWHLAHAPADFRNGAGGTSSPGASYTTSPINYADKNGNIIGTYVLTITAPPVGSTVVTVRSRGQAAGTAIDRTVETVLAKPSLAKFAVVANDDMRFGEGTEVFGQIHSNEGVRFDGLAHNVVTSALGDYNDPDHGGSDEFGVHTHVRPPPFTGIYTDNDNVNAESPPTAVPARSDVFIAGRQFPVPAVDFDGITADFSGMKTLAQANGRYFANSGNLGYHIVLKVNDTFDIYRVTSMVAPPNGCGNNNGQGNWGTWTINAETFIANYALPANGIIFTEDHAWVDGKIDSARVTVAAARFPQAPGQWRDIIVNRDLLYTNYDGRDVIALMAQGNFSVGWGSEDDLRIDAAVIAQNGRVGRYFYEKPGGGQNRCAPNDVRSALLLYGMVASSDRYGFAYTDDSGYQTRTLTYDSNLLYAPPPSFPLTADQYVVISWREVR